MSGVKMGWVERREGWRGRVGRTGRRERDFKGSQSGSAPASFPGSLLAPSTLRTASPLSLIGKCSQACMCAKSQWEK